MTKVPLTRELNSVVRIAKYLYPQLLSPVPTGSKVRGRANRSYATCFPLPSLILKQNQYQWPCLTYYLGRGILIARLHSFPKSKIRANEQIHFAPSTDSRSHDSGRYASPTHFDIQEEVLPYESVLIRYWERYHYDEEW
jgi:hypothetical protein